jgi:hypothetical protein
MAKNGLENLLALPVNVYSFEIISPGDSKIVSQPMSLIDILKIFFSGIFNLHHGPPYSP